MAGESDQKAQDMTEPMPSGWYYASGDPAGTVRYWDGELWQGGPVPDPNVAPQSGAVGHGAYIGWWPRVGAALVDTLLVAVAFAVLAIVVVIASALSDSLAWAVGIVAGLPVLFGALYLLYWMPGVTGQSPGRRLMGYAILHERDGRPIGGGAFLGRQLVGGIINQVCYIDYLWPLWDEKNQRIVDKMVSSVAVQQPTGKLLPIFPNGKPF